MCSPALAGDEIQINQMLDQGGNVHLDPRVYNIEGPIIIHSNTILSGEPGTILRVSSSSSQWFTGQIGIICNPTESLQNIEICFLEVDGNIGNLPRNFDSTPGHDRDAGKLILIGGFSSEYGNNIIIHDVKLYNAFSDGIYLRFTNNIQIYNNEIINCQHEGFFISACQNADVYNNKISGICSDGGRFMNSIFYKVRNNVFISFSGDSFGAFKGGEHGLQIGDQVNEVNHGFAPSYKPYTTDNAEVTGNIFGYSSEQAINLVNLQSNANIIINSNTYLDKAQLERAGIDFDLNYSIDNLPSVKESERVFSNIFNILDLEFTESGKTNQSLDSITYRVSPKNKDGVMGGIKILGFKDIVVIDKVPYIESNDSILIRSAAMSTPNPELWNGWISEKDDNVGISYNNTTVTATLTVKSKTYDYKKDNLTGKKERITKKTKTATFTDSYSPAPRVLNQPENITGTIYVYPTSFQVYVPQEGLVKINYKYIWNTSEHQLMSGVRNQTNEGVKFTEYSRVDRWTGDLEHQGDWVNVMGEFNPKMLNVTVDTPYKHIPVTNFNIIYKPFAKHAISGWFYPFLAIIVIVLFYIKWLLRDFRRY
jgi:parallel beta-helix repeat protein